MTAYEWTIDSGRTTPIKANAMDPSMPLYRKGEQQTLTFEFWDDPAFSNDHRTRYENLRQYGDYAGAGTVEQAIDGTPLVDERIPSSAPVDSLIIDLDPTGTEYVSTPGLWVFVEGIRDPTRYVKDTARVTLQVRNLAELSEHADRTALLNDQGTNII